MITVSYMLAGAAIGAAFGVGLVVGVTICSIWAIKSMEAE